ncbi:MAG: sugar phosphate isomerase/epimerase family protein [Armatimonadota bacterium]|jgi:sugar phosphate isomerase/epimerase
MYIGATTHILLDEIPLPEVLRRMADAGFEGGELALRHLRRFIESDNPEASAEEARATAEALGMPLPQVHLSVAEMGSLDPEKRQADLALMEREIELSALAGVQIGILHPVGGFPATLAEYREVERVRIDSFARACEIAAEHDFTIAIENTYDAHGSETSAVGRRRFGAIIPDLHAVIDAVGAGNFGICLDTGHTNLFGLPLGEAFRQCGDRLIATHVHDNDGHADQHIEPTRGTIDWQDGIAALHEIGWDGIFNLEIGPLLGHPIEAQMLRMRQVVETARWLIAP